MSPGWYFIALLIAWVTALFNGHTSNKYRKLYTTTKVEVTSLQMQLFAQQQRPTDPKDFFEFYKDYGIDWAAREMIRTLAADRDAWKGLYKQATEEKKA